MGEPLVLLKTLKQVKLTRETINLATSNISKGSEYNQRVRNITWIQDASSGESSFFKLSRKRPKIFSTQAVSCCLKSIAGYLASTCDTPSSNPINCNGDFGP